jgi:hypothetical protein
MEPFKPKNGYVLLLMENGERTWHYDKADGERAKSPHVKHIVDPTEFPSEYSTPEAIGQTWILAKQQVGKECGECHTKIAIHADDSMSCACLFYDVVADTLPAGWDYE